MSLPCCLAVCAAAGFRKRPPGRGLSCCCLRSVVAPRSVLTAIVSTWPQQSLVHNGAWPRPCRRQSDSGHLLRRCEGEEEGRRTPDDDGVVAQLLVAACPQRYRWHLEKNATQMPAISWQLTERPRDVPNTFVQSPCHRTEDVAVDLPDMRACRVLQEAFGRFQGRVRRLIRPVRTSIFCARVTFLKKWTPCA